MKDRFNLLKNKPSGKVSITTTDDLPQGTHNLYLTTTGGTTDNLFSCVNFNNVYNTLQTHLTNKNNPHSQILSGLRTHQTQLTLSQANTTVDITTSIGCLLVQSSNAVARTITIPNETTIGYQFANNASFTAFRYGSASLSVVAASGVTFVNAVGSSVTVPQNSYYIFIKQAINQWAVVTFPSSAASISLDQAYNNGVDGSITLVSGRPFLLKGSGSNQIANFDLNSVTFNANSTNPVMTIKSPGTQMHAPQIISATGAALDSTNIDSVFINRNVASTCNISIQLEPGVFYADNATFDAWRLNSDVMQVSAPSGVSINGSPGPLIVTLPAGAYYSFRRQSQNNWSYVLMSASSSQVVTSWNGLVTPVAVTAGQGIDIANGVITSIDTLQNVYNNSSVKAINFAAGQGLALIGDSSPGAQVNFSGLSQFSLNVSTSFTSALQQIDSTTQGWMGPRATKVQRNSIDLSQNPIGLETFNITDNTKDYWDGTQWQQLLTTTHILSGVGISIDDNLDGTVTVNNTLDASVTLQDAYDNSSDGTITVTPVKPLLIKDGSNNLIAEFGESYSSATHTTVVTSNTFTLTANAAENIFVMQNVGLCTLTLPANASAGQIFKIIGGNSTWTLQLDNISQAIHVFSNGSSFAATAISSNLPWDSAELSVNTDNLDFVLTQTNSPQLNFTT